MKTGNPPQLRGLGSHFCGNYIFDSPQAVEPSKQKWFERRRCDTKLHRRANRVPALRASAQFEVLIHVLRAAATECRAVGAVEARMTGEVSENI